MEENVEIDHQRCSGPTFSSTLPLGSAFKFLSPPHVSPNMLAALEYGGSILLANRSQWWLGLIAATYSCQDLAKNSSRCSVLLPEWGGGSFSAALLLLRTPQYSQD